MAEPFEGLGSALRWLRLQRGMKQYELAEAAGIAKGMMSAYERGKQNPSLENLGQILAALDADLPALQEALALVRLQPGPSEPSSPVLALHQVLGLPGPLPPEQEERARALLRHLGLGIRNFLDEDAFEV